MTTNEIKDNVIQLVNRLFSNKGYDVDILEYVDLVDDMGMDSITFVSILVEIELMFDIIIPDDMLLIDNFRKVNKIVNIVAKELESTSDNSEGCENDED